MRPLLAAKYNVAGRCFQAVEVLSDVCAGSLDCANGTGTTICAVAPSGDAYLTFLLYGEATNRADWHFEDNFGPPPTLTASDEALCTELRSAHAQIVDADGGVGSDMALAGFGMTSTGKSPSVMVTPVCD